MSLKNELWNEVNRLRSWIKWYLDQVSEEDKTVEDEMLEDAIHTDNWP